MSYAGYEDVRAVRIDSNFVADKMTTMVHEPLRMAECGCPKPGGGDGLFRFSWGKCGVCFGDLKPDDYAEDAA